MKRTTPRGDSRGSSRLASARRTPSAPRESRRRLPRPDRESTFGVFVQVISIPIAIMLVTGLSVYAHDVLLPAAMTAMFHHLLWYVSSVIRRPTLLLALPVVALFLWCFPWESILRRRPTQAPVREFRRGRRMQTQPSATDQAAARRGSRSRSALRSDRNGK